MKSHHTANGRKSRFQNLQLAFAFFAVLLTTACGLHAQTPAISSFSPTTVTAGSPSFTLTINGTNFFDISRVLIAGAVLTPTSQTATQLQVTVPAADVASVGVVQIQVVNHFGIDLFSNVVALKVINTPSPKIISAVPGISTQGAEEIQMTIVGSDFRPGATVVISPVLPSLNSSTGNTQASDIVILNVTVVSSSVITAQINVGTTAALGLRAIDVLNSDGTNSASTDSSQPFHVYPANTIAAPLTILNVGLITPRNGTVATQGELMNGEAVLAGIGTGTALGQWLWDGAVYEEFSVHLNGSASTTVSTQQPLPTTLIGTHTLQLRLTQPNKITTFPITLVVNPPGAARAQLMLPENSSRFAAATAPIFTWSPVPGAVRYQVGFANEPFFSAVTEWFDVDDNRWAMPQDEWQKLPAGSFYWTVRAIDSHGITRNPMPLRPIVRGEENVMKTLSLKPARNSAGHLQLEWTRSEEQGFYFVTISNDFEGNDVVRQYLTSDPQLDLRAVEGKLESGKTYYYEVDRISNTGERLSTGQMQSFVAEGGAAGQSLNRGPQHILLASANTPFSTMLGPSLGSMGDIASVIETQTPAPNSTTNVLQPAISVTFKQAVNPAEVSLMVDEVDVTTLAQVSGSKVSFTPPMAMIGGEHAINLSVGGDATSWRFTVLAPAPVISTPSTPALQPGTDAEAPAPNAPHGMPMSNAMAKKAAPPAAKPARPILEGKLGASTQWVSGSNPPDTNVISASEKMHYASGPWRIEANGSGLLNSVLNPPDQRTSHGQFNDYVFQLNYKNLPWVVNFRFGIISPTMYTDAHYISAATPRQAVEMTIKSQLGTIGGFTNTNDTALGGGSGINFHQKIEGASYDAPLPKWAAFRMMWLNAVDTGDPTTVGYDSMGNPIILPNPIAPQSTGDVLGALLKFKFNKKWQWTSEYAISHFNSDTTNPTSTRAFGRAWRTGVTGQVNKLKTSISYREESSNFGNPANPSMTESSQPNLRGANASVTDTTKAGNFGFTYTFLDNNVKPTTLDEIKMNTFDESYSKPFGKKASISFESRQTITTTGTVPPALVNQPPSVSGAADSRDIFSSVNFMRKVGYTTLTAAATRDWFRDNLTPENDTITSSIAAGANIAPKKSIFKLTANFNANWVSADGATTGLSSTYTTYIQPSWNWKHPALQLAPLMTVSKARTVLTGGAATNDSFTGQYGGRLSWTMPGWGKFSTLSAQGSYNQNHDNVAHAEQDVTQLMVLWTLTFKHKTTF